MASYQRIHGLYVRLKTSKKNEAVVSVAGRPRCQQLGRLSVQGQPLEGFTLYIFLMNTLSSSSNIQEKRWGCWCFSCLGEWCVFCQCSSVWLTTCRCIYMCVYLFSAFLLAVPEGWCCSSLMAIELPGSATSKHRVSNLDLFPKTL